MGSTQHTAPKKKRTIIDRNKITIKVRPSKDMSDKHSDLPGGGTIDDRATYNESESGALLRNEEEENCFQDLYECLNGLLD